MAKVVMYATRFCPYCIRARMLFKQKGVNYEEIAVDHQPELRKKMQKLSGRHTVPQIFINDKPIGGFDDLAALDRRNALDPLLNQ